MDYKTGKVDFTVDAGDTHIRSRAGNPNLLDMCWSGKKYGDGRKDAWVTSVSCHRDRGDWYLERVWSCFIRYESPLAVGWTTYR